MVITALVLAVAGWLTFGRMQMFINGNPDGLMPVLTSLQYWTPMHWREDRAGMLLPLLAMPVHHPLANLLTQYFLSSTLAVCAFLLIPRFLLGGPSGIRAGLLALAAYILTMPLQVQDSTFGSIQPYAFANGLAGLGLVALQISMAAGRPWRGGVAALLFLSAALWVSSAEAPILVGLLAGRWWIAREDGRAHWNWKGEQGITLFAMAVGMRIEYLIRKHSGWHRPYPKTPASEWPGGWLAMAHAAWDGFGHAVILGLAVASLVGVGALLARGRWRQPPLMAAVICWITAAGFTMLLGTLAHVKANGYSGRYSLAAIFFCFVAAGMLIAEVTRRAALPGALALLLGGLALRHGLPSPGTPRALICVPPYTTRAADLVDAGCTHILGNYWVVWPLVFHANLIAYERHVPGNIFGLSFRSEATVPLWSARPWRTWRIATLPGDPSIEESRLLCHLPRLVPAGHRGEVSLWRLASAP